jgi:dolichol kinase
VTHPRGADARVPATGTSQIVRQPVPLRAELARKTIHVASSAIAVAYAAGLPRASLLLLLAVLLAVAVMVEVARQRSAWARERFVGTVGSMLRAHEHDRWSGASWLLAAYALSAVLFPRDVAVAAMLAAGLGDASAAVVGRAVSRARARRGAPVTAGKTLVGSVACAVVTFAAASLVATLAPLSAMACALAAAAAERWDVPRSHPIDDNVRVSLAAGGAALLANLVAHATIAHATIAHATIAHTIA